MGNESNVPATLADAPTLKPVRTLDMIAGEIRAFTGCLLNNMIEIGRRLAEAREMLPHGEFIAWVNAKTGYSRSQANNLIRIFEEYAPEQGNLFGANVQTFGHLPYSKALALLAVPAEEREDFALEVDAENLSVRELKREIELYQQSQERMKTALNAERDKSAKLKQELDATSTRHEIELAKVRENERRNAEESLKLELDVLRDNAEKAEKYKAKLLGDLQKSEAKCRKAEQSASLAASKAEEKAIASMQAKVNAAEKRASDAEERAHQVELAHELHLQDTAKRAKEEAVAEMQSELDKANAALDEANASAKAASEAESKLRQELSEARKAASEDKPAAVDKGLVEFQLLFDTAKDAANKMWAIMLERRNQGDAATAQRLSGIMVALGDAIKEAAK